LICTALNYTCLRLLGEEANEKAMQEARKWIHDHGGVTMMASWGKLILSVQVSLLFHTPLGIDSFWQKQSLELEIPHPLM
jgi:Squalene-hopene cyclase N-terminal domain